MSNRYVFRMYERGEVILETEEMDLESAKRFFMANYNTGSALRLFVNDEKIPYSMTHKALKLSAAQRFAILNPGGCPL